MGFAQLAGTLSISSSSSNAFNKLFLTFPQQFHYYLWKLLFVEIPLTS